ncbi:hypothetical protein THTE_0894 [Thermogutta terrifontis]|uniref:Uncharacterized protein n=1 Tax=Thermogutta terrifontis TaxID=1331910 RepID=A0A286RC16_9BACT|nr:hypothetical protein THTE_0894 [Thermogutta terrifontis]
MSFSDHGGLERLVLPGPQDAAEGVSPRANWRGGFLHPGLHGQSPLDVASAIGYRPQWPEILGRCGGRSIVLVRGNGPKYIGRCRESGRGFAQDSIRCL